jgi:WD40 repeat protein
MWSPDGKTIASGSFDGSVKIWEAATGQVIRDLYPEGLEIGLTIVTWSPDGERIATLGRDGTGKIWDAMTGEELVRFTGHTSDVWMMPWSRTGERIFTSSADGTVRAWDTATGVELLRHNVGGFVDMDLSPDETRIVLGINPYNMLKVFPAWQTLQELIDYAKECCVVRELTDAERERLGLPLRQ